MKQLFLDVIRRSEETTAEGLFQLRLNALYLIHHCLHSINSTTEFDGGADAGGTGCVDLFVAALDRGKHLIVFTELYVAPSRNCMYDPSKQLQANLPIYNDKSKK